jgi:uncharacterized protein YbjT (DUF2867 family)
LRAIGHNGPTNQRYDLKQPPQDDTMTIFVAGATGETGRRIVRELIAQGSTVKALVRDRTTAESILPGAELVLGDVRDLAGLTQAIAGCEAVICATGARPSLDPLGPFTVDYVGTQNLVKAMQANGVDRLVIVSSLCVSKLFHPLNLFWGVLFWKKRAETYIQDSGLTYTIVRPGGLRNEDDVIRPLKMAAADQLFEGSLPRSLVAQVCVAALHNPDAANKIVEIVSSIDGESRSIEAGFAAI